MKTYGLLKTQRLLSIVTDDTGAPRLDTICPNGQYQLADSSAPWNQADPTKPDDLPEDAPWNPDPISHDPADYPGLLWTPPALAELVKLPRPETAPGQTADPVLIWTDTSVTRDWEVRNMTLTELADSTRKVWPSTHDFLIEFTQQEMGQIATSTDPGVSAARFLFSIWNGRIFSDDPRVISGLDSVMGAGIINAQRRAQIIAK